MVSATVLTLLVIPALYAIVKGWQTARSVSVSAPASAQHQPSRAAE